MKLFPRDLERAVEELSELIESPLDPEVIISLRQKVTDKTVSRDQLPVIAPIFTSLPGLCSEA